MKYGLYDTKDNVWLGDEKGPFIFDTNEEPLGQGRIRAAICDAQFEQRIGRTEARELTRGVYTHRDSVDIKRDALTALEMLEDGKL